MELEYIKEHKMLVNSGAVYAIPEVLLWIAVFEHFLIPHSLHIEEHIVFCKKDKLISSDDMLFLNTESLHDWGSIRKGFTASLNWS